MDSQVCPCCGKLYKSYYDICKKCFLLLKQESEIVAQIEFEKQINLPREKWSDCFSKAEFEIFHTNCYTKLSEKEYIEKVRKEFISLYSEEYRIQRYKLLRKK